jgi:hypothetical protein
VIDLEQAVDGLTPVQQRMLVVLSDGNHHPIEDLYRCLEDTNRPVHNVHPHITAIRKALNPVGRDVECVRRNRVFLYIQVVLAK